MRRLVIDVHAFLRQRTSIVGYHMAARDQARDVERAVRRVAREAAGPSNRDGSVRRLIERVEDDALLWIVCRNLDDGSARDVADREGLVEEQRAGIVRVRDRLLCPRFREHEELGFERHTQCGQQGLQIAGLRVSPESRSGAGESFIQPGDAIGRRSGRVLDGGMGIERSDARVLALTRD